MASIWEKAISILAGNLNSGRSYLITTVYSHTGLIYIMYLERQNKDKELLSDYFRINKAVKLIVQGYF